MAYLSRSILFRIAAIGIGAATLAACQEAGSSIPKDIRPVSGKLVSRMQEKDMSETSPVFIRIFKESSELEVWKEQRSGKYALLKTYTICKWSGVLGPKVKEGDRQAPEGFYVVTPAQMNPKSSYYLSFNIGYPNAFDKSLGRTGTHLMVHGACSSAGCYSMTDADAGELFAIARDAFRGGQRAFQIQAFPFRMTPENFAKHQGDPNTEFWKMLKIGYDHFEVTRQEPKVDVCGKRYVFDAEAGTGKFVAGAKCPKYTIPEWIATAVAAKEAADEKKYSSAVAALAADAQQKAEQQQQLQAERDAEAAVAARAASKPPLLSRWFGRGSKTPPPENMSVDPSTTATPSNAATPISATPLPRPKPGSKQAVEARADVDAAPASPAAKPKKTAAAKPATKPKADPPKAEAAAPQPEPPPTPAATAAATEPFPDLAAAAAPAPAAPTKVGKVVQRDFFWADEPATAN